jgi:signal transduction histidine kinase
MVDSGVPRSAPDGAFLGYIGSAIDITDHKYLEQEREEARAEAERQAEQLDRVFEQMADGVAVYDARGRLVRTNLAMRHILGLDAAPPTYYQMSLPERAGLYAVRDEQGRPVTREEGPLARALHGEALTEAGAWDVRMRTLDGREVELTVSAAPLRNSGGRLVGAVSIYRDRTERKRLEREREEARASELALREVTRHMEEFLATAAHDLRSPITGVVMGADLAQRRLQRLAEAVAPSPKSDRPAGLQDDVRAALSALEHASQAAQRLSRLIVRLFDVAEARTGKLEVRLAPCDLATLVREEVAAQRLSVPDRTIHLDLPANGAEPVLVVADGDRIGQVVANYLANALKYAPPDRPIVVSVEVGERQARVAVRDDGPGLPPEEQTRVWDLFHRAAGVAVQNGWGGSLGLGLYICKTIVELHPGGQVGVESEVGHGSTFWFSLPLATGDAAQDAADTQQRQPPS